MAQNVYLVGRNVFLVGRIFSSCASKFFLSWVKVFPHGSNVFLMGPVFLLVVEKLLQSFYARSSLAEGQTLAAVEYAGLFQ